MIIKKLYTGIKKYVFDSTIEIRERMFILFSITVLLALFAAVPAGLIMREPISATVSTFVGALLFSLYVGYAAKKRQTDRARIVISFVLVFAFLPAMFFTNGGAQGGTPTWLLLGTIYITLILEKTWKKIMLVCEVVIMTACWIVGFYFPHLVTEYSRAGNYFDSLAGLFIVSAIVGTLMSFQVNLFRKEEAQKNVQRLFAQTATALVNAIDKKDEYTHGHSSRVAEYSKKIAQHAGKTPSECEEIFYIALLHDVGKIGIPKSIINKGGNLTNDEYEIIKRHPVMGAQILQSITEYPFISIGAHFHHERYDGKGYPMGLKGSDIPEIARIIAVADAYDAMTSKRSYRNAIPQNDVREEIIKGIGTQFDPKFANIMIHLIDLDPKYEMKENEDTKDLSGKSEMAIGTHREYVAEGIVVQQNITSIEIKVTENKTNSGRKSAPSLILFDSLDGRYHTAETEKKKLLYFEYAEISFDGHVAVYGARKIETTWKEPPLPELDTGIYRLEAVKVKDHVLLRVMNSAKTFEAIMALPDSSRFVYIGLTGTNCCISNLKIEKSKEKVSTDYIPRIAEEISYIKAPAGNIPNVQVDGYRTDSSVGIPIRDGMKIVFHTKALPTARLVWHCPSYVIFYSKDGTISGKDYQEYSLVRLDGENWETEKIAENTFLVNKQDFLGWDSWKAFNTEGYDSSVSFHKQGNEIVSTTENFGISIRCTTVIKCDAPEIYVALSGDQCALTNIRIFQEG